MLLKEAALELDRTLVELAAHVLNLEELLDTGGPPWRTVARVFEAVGVAGYHSLLLIEQVNRHWPPPVMEVRAQLRRIEREVKPIRSGLGALTEHFRNQLTEAQRRWVAVATQGLEPFAAAVKAAQAAVEATARPVRQPAT